MESFKKWLLNEMPANVQHLGNWTRQPPLPGFTHIDDKKQAAKFKQHGWKFDDFSLLTNPNAVEKITRKWAKVEQDVEFYVFRSKDAYRYQEVGEVHEDFVRDKLKLNVVDSPEAMKHPMDIYLSPHAINMIYTNNLSGDRTPFTAWTAAHRFGHAIKRDNGFVGFQRHMEKGLRDILKDGYGVTLKKNYSFFDVQSDKIITDFIKNIGTMKSARDGTVRNFNEFSYEVLAQYLLTGGVKFNPLPVSFMKKWAWGRSTNTIRYQGYPHRPDSVEEYDGHNESLQSLSRELMYYANLAMDNCIGKVFVM